MKIIITGVAGFIGSNLADSLIKEGYKNIIGIDNLSYGLKSQIPNEVDFFQHDIRSSQIFDVFDEGDTVFHLAAKNSIVDCQTNPLETVDININGTLNVFNAAIKKKVRKVIYAESSAVYEGINVFPTTEDQLKPESFYAISKFCTHYFAKSYKQYFGLDSIALRYFNVYGPRQDYRRSIPPVVVSFIISMLKGERPVIYGDGTKKRDFVYVDDVNEFHLITLEDNRTDGETFNLGSGKNYSVLDIYHELESILDTGLEPIFKDDLPGEAQENLADISMANKVGWEPKTDLRQGLLNSIEYIQENVLPTLVEI
tara:strand:- start:363 stop:1301 length:939 start_codon:yes stop_codon:yes gene_type:complete